MKTMKFVGSSSSHRRFFSYFIIFMPISHIISLLFKQFFFCFQRLQHRVNQSFSPMTIYILNFWSIRLFFVLSSSTSFVLAIIHRKIIWNSFFLCCVWLSMYCMYSMRWIEEWSMEIIFKWGKIWIWMIKCLIHGICC